MTTAAEFFATVVAELDARGVRLTKQRGEYVVNFRAGTDRTVYMTDDLTDAIEHGRALAKSVAPAQPTTSTTTPGKRYRHPRRMTPKAQRRRMIRQHNRRMQARAKHRDDK